MTFKVDERVERLGEIAVGDVVKSEYYVSLAAELREPTAEEKEEPLVVLEGAAKAPAGAPPGAGGVRVIRAVVTVEGLHRPTQTLTVKGPLGNYLAILTGRLGQLIGG